MRRANQVEDELYHKLSEALGNEGVGEYHRALCDPSFTTRPKRHLNPLLRGFPLKLEKLLSAKVVKPIVVKFQPLQALLSAIPPLQDLIDQHSSKNRVCRSFKMELRGLKVLQDVSADCSYFQDIVFCF